jgi:malonate decarboxylase epsilon subunit
MRVALLFPGQGAQTPGFLARLGQHPAVRETIAAGAAVLGMQAQRLDDAAALASTAGVQLSTVIAGVATARALAAEGFVADAVAGLSVGAFSAAVACESVSFEDALRLVQLRGAAMAQAAPRGYGMTAILGLSERRVRELVARVNARAPLYLASINSATELIVSGDESALALAAQEAGAAGAAARRLRVTIPSHCPIMEGVSARLRAALQPLSLLTPRCAYVTNHRARIAVEATQVAEDLILNASRTVLWHDSMTLLYELGCRLFVECPPGEVLSALVKDSLPEVRALALERVPLATAVTLARR